MNRLRLGAALHFIIAIGHVACLFALDEAYEAYSIRDIMHQMVSGHVWMLYALTIGLVFAFIVAGLYALASNTPAHKIYERLGFEYRGKQHLYAENTGWTDFYFFDYAQQHVFEYKNK